MASNKAFSFGPVALANAAANILNPPAATGGVNAGAAGQYIILRKIRIVNKTDSNATYSLFIGATGASAAGTEFMGSAKPILARAVEDWQGCRRLDIADFLTGFASAAATLTIEGEGEIGVA